jgi:hypothetical protein
MPHMAEYACCSSVACEGLNENTYTFAFTTCLCVLCLLLCPRPGSSRYVLPTPTGDTGIVRTLDVPVYLTECNDTTLHCLDRDGKTMSIMIDNSGTCSHP